MDENLKIEEHLRKLEDLLKKLVAYWHLSAINKALDLKISESQLETKATSGDKSEVFLLYALAEVLIPEDWLNLGTLIRDFRTGGRTRERCLREAILRAKGKQKQAVWLLAAQRKEEERQQQEAVQDRARQLAAQREEEERQQQKAQQERARQLAAQREEEERRREREQELIDLQERIRRDEEKQTGIQSIRDEFQRDFLNAHTYYKTWCSAYITAEEFEKEKAVYVQSWVNKNLGFEPDLEQAAAIGAVDGHVQLVARAGSGKTATLVNRALFLQQHCHVSPDEMLLLAFNRKAAEEMRDRLTSKLQGAIPHTMTFHALAFALVHPEESILYDEPDGSQSKSRVLQTVIDDYLRHPDHYQTIRALMLAHFREDWARIALGGYDKTPEKMLRYRRSLPREALDGKYLKSFGEKVIADFLFEHDIKYRYERNFWWNGGNYRPDFTIFTGDSSGVIIEYFGLKGDPDYDDMSEEKREYWRARARWSFLEYSPQDLRDREAFLERLQQDIEHAGVVCKRLSEEEVWFRIKDRAIDRFTNLVVNFVQRCRKQSWSPEQLAGGIARHKCANEVEQQFLNLAQGIYGTFFNN
jgi:DNA helicase IV